MTIKKAFSVDSEGFFTLGYSLLLKNLVELGGFEPPSEITTPSALHA